jgi:hypothetical protein
MHHVAHAAPQHNRLLGRRVLCAQRAQFLQRRLNSHHDGGKGAGALAFKAAHGDVEGDEGVGRVQPQRNQLCFRQARCLGCGSVMKSLRQDDGWPCSGRRLRSTLFLFNRRLVDDVAKVSRDAIVVETVCLAFANGQLGLPYRGQVETVAAMMRRKKAVGAAKALGKHTRQEVVLELSPPHLLLLLFCYGPRL